MDDHVDEGISNNKFTAAVKDAKQARLSLQCLRKEAERIVRAHGLKPLPSNTYVATWAALSQLDIELGKSRRDIQRTRRQAIRAADTGKNINGTKGAGRHKRHIPAEFVNGSYVLADIHSYGTYVSNGSPIDLGLRQLDGSQLSGQDDVHSHDPVTVADPACCDVPTEDAMESRSVVAVREAGEGEHFSSGILDDIGALSDEQRQRAYVSFMRSFSGKPNVQSISTDAEHMGNLNLGPGHGWYHSGHPMLPSTGIFPPNGDGYMGYDGTHGELNPSAVVNHKRIPQAEHQQQQPYDDTPHLASERDYPSILADPDNPQRDHPSHDIARTRSDQISSLVHDDGRLSQSLYSVSSHAANHAAEVPPDGQHQTGPATQPHHEADFGSASMQDHPLNGEGLAETLATTRAVPVSLHSQVQHHLRGTGHQASNPNKALLAELSETKDKLAKAISDRDSANLRLNTVAREGWAMLRGNGGAQPSSPYGVIGRVFSALRKERNEAEEQAKDMEKLSTEVANRATAINIDNNKLLSIVQVALSTTHPQSTGKLSKLGDLLKAFPDVSERLERRLRRALGSADGEISDKSDIDDEEVPEEMADDSGLEVDDTDPEDEQSEDEAMSEAEAEEDEEEVQTEDPDEDMSDVDDDP